jgi:hypothetical protein
MWPTIASNVAANLLETVAGSSIAQTANPVRSRPFFCTTAVVLPAERQLGGCIVC